MHAAADAALLPPGADAARYTMLAMPPLAADCCC